MGAGTAFDGTKVSSFTKTWTETLTLDTNAYAAGDYLADRLELTRVSRVAGLAVVLQSLTVIDVDDQGAAFDVLLFSQSFTAGTKNNAWAVTDAEMVAGFQGGLRIAAADYVDLGGNRVATLSGLGLVLQPAATSLFVGTISQGSPTYTAAGLTLIFGFLRD